MSRNLDRPALELRELFTPTQLGVPSHGVVGESQIVTVTASRRGSLRWWTLERRIGIRLATDG